LPLTCKLANRVGSRSKSVTALAKSIPTIAPLAAPEIMLPVTIAVPAPFATDMVNIGSVSVSPSEVIL